MSADPRVVPFRLLLEFERERLRLCRDALQLAGSPQVARAWAAAVQDAERRVQQLVATCRELGPEPPVAPPASLPVHAFAAAMVGDLQGALEGQLPPKLATSTGTPATADGWELRVG